VLFFLQNSTQIPSLEEFIIIYVCYFIKLFFKKFIYWERKGNFKTPTEYCNHFIFKGVYGAESISSSMFWTLFNATHLLPCSIVISNSCLTSVYLAIVLDIPRDLYTTPILVTNCVSAGILHYIYTMWAGYFSDYI